MEHLEQKLTTVQLFGRFPFYTTCIYS